VDDQRPATIPTTTKNKAPTARPILLCHEARAGGTTVDGDPGPDADEESVVTDGKGFVGEGLSGEEDSDVCLDPFSS